MEFGSARYSCAVSPQYRWFFVEHGQAVIVDSDFMGGVLAHFANSVQP